MKLFKTTFHLSSITRKEVIFQTVLHILVFVFFAFRKHNPKIELYQFAFFLNYSFSVFFINYAFLPNYYYKKEYRKFAVAIVLVLLATVAIEEVVLENVFFPDTRGNKLSLKTAFFCLINIFPLMATLSGFKFAWDAMQKQREVEELQTAVKDSELQFLKSQINPHFLFNNLNNLYAYAIEESSKTPEIILQLSSVLRYMLYECREEYVPLSKEVEHLENFIQLNEIQIEERGTVSFKQKAIGSEYKIAPLILIVFVENAFKHSTASQSDKISIHVEMELLGNDMLEFRCVNSYHAQSNTEKLAHGIGLENVKKRLELIYPNSFELHIEKSEANYSVNLRVKLSKL